MLSLKGHKWSYMTMCSVASHMSGHLKTNSVCSMQSLQVHPYLGNVDTLDKCTQCEYVSSQTGNLKTQKKTHVALLFCFCIALCTLHLLINIYQTKHCICNWETFASVLSFNPIKAPKVLSQDCQLQMAKNALTSVAAAISNLSRKSVWHQTETLSLL